METRQQEQGARETPEAFMGRMAQIGEEYIKVNEKLVEMHESWKKQGGGDIGRLIETEGYRLLNDRRIELLGPLSQNLPRIFEHADGAAFSQVAKEMAQNDGEFASGLVDKMEMESVPPAAAKGQLTEYTEAFLPHTSLIADIAAKIASAHRSVVVNPSQPTV